MMNEDNKNHIEDGKQQLPQEEAAAATDTSPPRNRRKWMIVLIAILVLLVIAGLVIGLVLGLDDDDDDDTSGISMECLDDTDELHENSPALQDTQFFIDWMDCEFNGNSAYCTVEQPAESINKATQVCQAAGGKIFTFDDWKLCCKARFEGVGTVTMTMNFVSYTECLAQSCDITDDEAFEKDMANYLGAQIEDENEESAVECNYIK